jgi:hypothetical protein
MLDITIGYRSRLTRIMGLGAFGASHNSLSVKVYLSTGRREMSRISGFENLAFLFSFKHFLEIFI